MKINQTIGLRSDCHAERPACLLLNACSRRGVLVIEMVVCAILLATVSLMLLPALQGVARQQSAIRLESLTRIELNNQHQLLVQQDPGLEPPGDLKPSVWFQEQYPGVSLKCTAVESQTDSKGLPRAFRLTVRHHIHDRQLMFERSVVIWLPDRGAQQ